MRVVGIIAEYNPFHNGHLFHLNAAKKAAKADYSVAVMSGHFMQRGAPALFHKWARAENAVRAGVDLVLELPVDFSLSSAERFASGGVSLLNSLSVVTHIAFGAESSLPVLQEIAQKLAHPSTDYEKELKNWLNTGLSFPEAREKALNADHKVIGRPNNILAIEYLKALSIQNSKIIPLAIPRHAAGHHDASPQGSFASGSTVRRLLEQQRDVRTLVPGLPDSPPCFPKQFDQLALYAFLAKTPEQIAFIHEVSEGLENRLVRAAHTSATIEEFLKAVKTKRYSFSRLSRIVYSNLLNIQTVSLSSAPLYARVLAFNQKGAFLLKCIRKATDFPIITKPSRYPPEIKRELALDYRASEIYFLASGLTKKGEADLTTSPIFLPF